MLVDLANALSNPIAYQSNLEKHTQQLMVLTEEFDVEGDENNSTDLSERVSVTLLLIVQCELVSTLYHILWGMIRYLHNDGHVYRRRVTRCLH